MTATRKQSIRSKRRVSTPTTGARSLPLIVGSLVPNFAEMSKSKRRFLRKPSRLTSFSAVAAGPSSAWRETIATATTHTDVNASHRKVGLAVAVQKDKDWKDAAANAEKRKRNVGEVSGAHIRKEIVATFSLPMNQQHQVQWHTKTRLAKNAWKCVRMDASVERAGAVYKSEQQTTTLRTRLHRRNRLFHFRRGRRW